MFSQRTPVALYSGNEKRLKFTLKYAAVSALGHTLLIMATRGEDVDGRLAKVENTTKVNSGRYIVLQWNDYRKENFLAFLGGFSNIQKAREVQLRCLEGFQKEGWIKNLPYVFGIQTCDPSWSVKVGKSSKNLIERKIIGLSDEEPEMFTVDIYYVRDPKTTKSTPELEQVKVETCWGGWGGRNACFVEKQIPSIEHLSQPGVALANLFSSRHVPKPTSDTCTEIDIDLSGIVSTHKEAGSDQVTIALITRNTVFIDTALHMYLIVNMQC